VRLPVPRIQRDSQRLVQLDPLYQVEPVLPEIGLPEDAVGGGRQLRVCGNGTRRKKDDSD